MRHRAQGWLVAGLAVLVLDGVGSPRAGGEETVMTERTVLETTFDDLPDGPLPEGWWAEGGLAAGVRDGALFMEADPPVKGAPGCVGTIWCPTPLPADVRLELDATVTGSSFLANNLNLFLFYTRPDGQGLYETRAERADGAYPKYHDLHGYIMTFLNDFEGTGGRAEDGATRARFRMRRCPGFTLVNETFASHCRLGQTYHLTVTRRTGRLALAVDGVEYLAWDDPEPWPTGLLGLRTYHTDVRWDNLRIVALEG